MRIYDFSRDAGRQITAYDSRNLVMSRILSGTDSEVHVGCMHIGAEGIVGLHQATVPQLLLVVQGEGVVTGAEQREIPIRPGQAAFWEAGEWHETRSSTGMTAIVIESRNLDVGMPEAER